MKTTSEQKQEAYKYLKQFRHKEIAAVIKSVSKSGMSRRIEFYSKGFQRIGWYLSQINEYSYDADKGMSVSGCGMDMIFHVISNFNYWAAQQDYKQPLNVLTGKGGELEGKRVYDNYFFNADQYKRL
jgi:hypothetical protein